MDPVVTCHSGLATGVITPAEQLEVISLIDNENHIAN